MVGWMDEEMMDRWTNVTWISGKLDRSQIGNCLS